MNYGTFLKAMTIFNIISNIATTVFHGAPIAKVEVPGVVHDAVKGLVSSGHLPDNFGNDIGKIIDDVATIHPAVKNE